MPRFRYALEPALSHVAALESVLRGRHAAARSARDACLQGLFELERARIRLASIFGAREAAWFGRTCDLRVERLERERARRLLALREARAELDRARVALERARARRLRFEFERARRSIRHRREETQREELELAELANPRRGPFEFGCELDPA
jgi:multidrug resistance efflux pump